LGNNGGEGPGKGEINKKRQRGRAFSRGVVFPNFLKESVRLRKKKPFIPLGDVRKHKKPEGCKRGDTIKGEVPRREDGREKLDAVEITKWPREKKVKGWTKLSVNDTMPKAERGEGSAVQSITSGKYSRKSK